MNRGMLVEHAENIFSRIVKTVSTEMRELGQTVIKLV